MSDRRSSLRTLSRRTRVKLLPGLFIVFLVGAATQRAVYQRNSSDATGGVGFLQAARSCHPSPSSSIQSGSARTLARTTRAGRVARRAAAAASSEAAEAREKYLSLLESKAGDWRDEEVMKALEALEPLSPTANPALSGDYQDAEWVQVSAPDYNYAGEEGSSDYTLGALSFNMYEPRDAKVRVDKTTQVVAPLDEEEGTRRWDISLSLTFIDERYPPFKAKLTTFGQIRPDKDDDDVDRRLRVKFPGGELAPDLDGSEATLEQWKEVMSTAQKGKPKFDVGEMVKGAVMKFGMGLQAPGEIAEDGKIAWVMNRPPEGYTDVLYLDDKLRVTRGNRGSIVAVVRGD
mmetsp:Transcript_7428/g.16364  ORF Transcript_7428/g.16364 Transcript_7428/m.16364 type:complete len:346 (-) Transcript_7428:103-1140(-)|eukprot:CAMPEP_0178413922 /NCGR_PEP_ID=MMETSP0689_2-20121128/22774_1 /TAXON_ID=160604 /ORGANISM="Amphidinium massartii, Strain CS-259" /LENGTH=345 /DNA_ID=CAMNT_0020035203 /DNA_START=125 /DNA_END=1162 /DNA_ORIENTATION=+